MREAISVTANPNATLSPWHARQAAMLYEYSSVDYLKKLHQVVSQLIEGVVDPLLTVAISQGRDALLAKARWGTRDCAQNWSNNAWPFLRGLQISLAKDIALRAFDKYEKTATNECLRGAEQFSMLWATPEEEREYLQGVALINFYAGAIDDTLDTQPRPRWNDFGFYYRFKGFKAQSPRIPKFRIRTDLVGETGKLPPRTGVYIAADDPNAAVQFAVAGAGGIALREAATFNEIGLEALAALGRKNLWFNEQKMLEFATKSRHAPLFRKWLEVDRVLRADLAPSAVTHYAFMTKPARWYFVEIVPDEFEDVEPIWKPEAPLAVTRRLFGGEVCQEPGFYFSPAKTDSRKYFQVGERMPIFATTYGETIWQWDAKQE